MNISDFAVGGRVPRRAFLEAAGGLAFLSAARAFGESNTIADRPRVAAIVTECTYRSHAHVFLENFLNPYPFNGKKTEPGVEVVSLYVDQYPSGEMARSIAHDFAIPLYPTIEQALTRGTNGLAVDAVLTIGEHGRYPFSTKGQREYPRKWFFDEVVAVFKRAGKSVPYFNDKHLSYRADWSHEMVDEAKAVGFPMMAGSSVPLAQRIPPLELEPESLITEAVSIHGGSLESYDFHGLEVLQSMVESRKGGETGVRMVRFLEGDELWNAAERGEWSPELASAALATEIGTGRPPLRELLRTDGFKEFKPHAILLEYRSGLRAIMLRIATTGKIGDNSTRWLFACRVEGKKEPLATKFYVGPWANRNLFKALSHAVQEFFRTGTPPYPVERTLLTSCVLDAAMDSFLAHGAAQHAPSLAIAYQPTDFHAFREMGASWKIIPEGTPEPKGLDQTGKRL